MTLPTWRQLTDFYCSIRKGNPHYEDFAGRRYNYSPSKDRESCRLVFLKEVLKDGRNKTLCRHGRFIWCKNLQYEGRDKDGFRQISFTVDAGQKRFKISENNILCVPSKTYVNNNRYFRSRMKTFTPFSSVFGYQNTLNMMAKNGGHGKEQFEDMVKGDSPFKPGTLVAPRMGYFHPESAPNVVGSTASFLLDTEHPCGIILGRSLIDDRYVGKEFYRVRFGDTTYERIHPVQMEIINEV